MKLMEDAGLDKVAAELGVSAEDMKSIERAQRKESFIIRAIGLISIVGSFFAGATVSVALGTDAGANYPYAVIPYAAFWRTSRRKYAAVLLASIFSALMGYLMMVRTGTSARGHSYYSVFGRQS